MKWNPLKKKKRPFLSLSSHRSFSKTNKQKEEVQRRERERENKKERHPTLGPINTMRWKCGGATGAIDPIDSISLAGTKSKKKNGTKQRTADNKKVLLWNANTSEDTRPKILRTTTTTTTKKERKIKRKKKKEKITPPSSYVRVPAMLFSFSIFFFVVPNFFGFTLKRKKEKRREK